MASNLRRIDSSHMPGLARLADEVRATNTARIVRRGDADVAVLISPEQWDRYQQQVMDECFRAIDESRERNRVVDPDEVERDVTDAVEEVRRQRRRSALSRTPRISITEQTAGIFKLYRLARPLTPEDERAAFEQGVADEVSGTREE